MYTQMNNVYRNEKCLLYPNEKMYTQNATQSKPNQMKIVCPDTGYTQINSTP